MHSGALFSSLSVGRWSIHLIRQTFHSLLHPQGRYFAHKTSGTGDLSDTLNAASPSYWKCDQDALKISSVSEIYPTAVIWVFWVQDSFCVAHWLWLPFHISKIWWMVAILCNFLCSSLTSFRSRFQHLSSQMQGCSLPITLHCLELTA